MGIVEAMIIWVAVSMLFCASLGKVLSAIDRRTTAREEAKRVQRRQFLTSASA